MFITNFSREILPLLNGLLTSLPALKAGTEWVSASCAAKLLVLKVKLEFTQMTGYLRLFTSMHLFT